MKHRLAAHNMNLIIQTNPQVTNKSDNSIPKDPTKTCKTQAPVPDRFFIVGLLAYFDSEENRIERKKIRSLAKAL